MYAAYDYKHVLQIFTDFIEWVKINPFGSTLAIMGIYSGLIIFTLPILYLTIALGYAYSKAFESNV